MTDRPKNSPQDWENIDKIIRKEDQSSLQTSAKPLEALEKYTDGIRENKLDLLGRFKAGGMQRRAALEMLNVMYEAQLDASKHALARAVDVQKERVDVIAKKYIFEITQEYLRDMETLGLQNFQARMQTLLTLNEEAAKLLRQAEGQDVPERMKKTTIEAILKKYHEFLAQLVADEIKLK